VPRKIGISVLFLLLHASIVSASTPDTGRWEPIPELWDEFSATTLDSRKWDSENIYYKGKKPGMFVPNNIQVTDHQLRLWAREEAPPLSLSGYHSYTTSAISSRHEVKYGYFEIKAKVMQSRVNNAFWLYRWTDRGTYEIDIFEISGGHPQKDTFLHTNAHVYFEPPEFENDTNRISDPMTCKSSVPLADDFHTYGLEWNEAEIKWYYDNRLVRTKKNQYWHTPMFIKLSVETHPDWFGLPKKGELPAAMEIQYFRAWKKQAPPSK
jgi:beta-glucanase (GH16 family)